MRVNNNLKQLVDYNQLLEIINERKGGLKKIEDFEDNICRHPEHNPPNMIVLSPGKYEYTCPGCGGKTIFTVPLITC